MGSMVSMTQAPPARVACRTPPARCRRGERRASVEREPGVLGGRVDRLDLPTSADPRRVQEPHAAGVGEVDATASIDGYGGGAGLGAVRRG